MRGPITVCVKDGDRELDVTGATSRLSFSKSAYGGHKGLTGLIQVPRGTFHDLGPGDTVTVYDARTGGVLWAGDTNNPGAVGGPFGEAYDVVAVGGMGRLQAVARPLAYVYRDMAGWERSPNSTKGAQTRQDQKGDEPVLEVFWPEGKTVGTSQQGEWVNRVFREARLDIGRVRADVDAGVGGDAWAMRLRTGPTTATVTASATRGASTGVGTLVVTRGAGLVAGDRVVGLNVARNTSAATATDDHWFRFSDVRIRQVVLDAFGNDAGDYSRNTVYAHEVITDMLGRGMFPGVDPYRAVVGLTSYPIDALAWLGGVTMGDALTELLSFEPALFWMAAGEAFTAGLFDEDNPRYVLSERDGGIELPGSDDTRANRVLVTWTDKRGREQTTEVTTEVDGLDYRRDYTPGVSLPEGFGSEGNAQRAGERLLAELNNPPQAGRALIRRQIVDEWVGCPVHPAELEPGCVAVVQETGEKYRVTETDHSDADGSTVLTLGQPTRSAEQILRRLKRIERRVKRRR